LLVLVCVVACSLAVEVQTVEGRDPIDSQYILVFHPSVSDEQRHDHMKTLFQASTDGFSKIIHSFNIGDFKGFSAKLSSDLLELQKNSPLLSYIEQDAVIRVAQTCSQQSNAVWGLDRVAERDLDLDGVYRYGNTGSGVDAYVVDTGVNINHKDFVGRAIWGANFADNINSDCNGHGTHVAGTIGGTTYGVAKKSTLIAVKVLDCNGSGTNAGVIAGVNWVVSSYQTRRRPSVANMSLGGGRSTALDNAVAAAIKAGVTFAVAAGNENQDACNSSPAAVSTAVTVGATGTDSAGSTQVDNRAYFSNFGSCVSLFAPGLMIQSTWIGTKNTETQTISGTSMATPHVAGVIAAYLQTNPNATPSQVKSWLVSNGSAGLVRMDCSGSGSTCSKSPNIFVYSPCSADL